MPHPDDDTLRLFASGRLDDDRETEIELHLSQCPTCSQRLTELERDEPEPILRDVQVALHDDSAATGASLFETTGNTGSEPLNTEGFTVGDRLGDNFRLEKQLGRGGMGIAWKAFDETAERFVVLKFVPKAIQHVVEAMHSVRESFKKVHALQHQHVCPLYGLFNDPQYGLYIAMKFVDGLPLDIYRRKYIEKHGTIPFDDIVQILWGVAKGLDYAHDRNVIHRDIKPQNIMIGKTDGVQLIDFGLAEEIRSLRQEESVSKISGTRSYMAPEQWEGKTQDARTDQYALAVTAYELLAGHVPFYSKDSETLKNQVLHDPAEPIHDLSESVNATLFKALSKKREDRFENCKAFVRELALNSDDNSGAIILPVDRLADDLSQPTWLPPASLSSTSETLKRKRIIPTIVLASTLFFMMLVGFLWWSRTFDETETGLDRPPEPPMTTKRLSLGVPDYSGSGFTNEMLDNLKHPVEFPIIRTTLLMDEYYNGVLRVERCMSDTPPDNYFKGEPFTHSAFPNALAFRGENGMGRVIWGFNDSVETSWDRYHGACGRLKGACKNIDGTLRIHGWGDIGVFNNHPPIRLCCDFPDAQPGQASVFIGGGGGKHGEYARAWFFTRYDGPNSYTVARAVQDLICTKI